MVEWGEFPMRIGAGGCTIETVAGLSGQPSGVPNLFGFFVPCPQQGTTCGCLGVQCLALGLGGRMDRCPECGNTLQDALVVCDHCGEILPLRVVVRMNA